MWLCAFHSLGVSTPETLLVPQVSEELLFHSVTPELREWGLMVLRGSLNGLSSVSDSMGLCPCCAQRRTDIGHGGRCAPQLGPAGLPQSAVGWAPCGSPQPDLQPAGPGTVWSCRCPVTEAAEDVPEHTGCAALAPSRSAAWSHRGRRARVSFMTVPGVSRARPSLPGASVPLCAEMKSTKMLPECLSGSAGM